MGEDQNTTRFAGSKDSLLTRRGLLQRAVWILPATALLARWTRSAQEVSPVMAKLSTYMAGAANGELPKKAVQDTSITSWTP